MSLSRCEIDRYSVCRCISSIYCHWTRLPMGLSNQVDSFIEKILFSSYVCRATMRIGWENYFQTIDFALKCFFWKIFHILFNTRKRERENLWFFITWRCSYIRTSKKKKKLEFIIYECKYYAYLLYVVVFKLFKVLFLLKKKEELNLRAWCYIGKKFVRA